MKILFVTVVIATLSLAACGSRGKHSDAARRPGGDPTDPNTDDDAPRPPTPPAPDGLCLAADLRSAGTIMVGETKDDVVKAIACPGGALTALVSHGEAYRYLPGGLASSIAIPDTTGGTILQLRAGAGAGYRRLDWTAEGASLKTIADNGALVRDVALELPAYVALDDFPSGVDAVQAMCASRDPVQDMPNQYYRIATQIAVTKDESRIAVVAATACYADLYIFDASGKRLAHHLVTELAPDTFMVFLPMSTLLTEDAGRFVVTSQERKPGFRVVVVDPADAASATTFAPEADLHGLSWLAAAVQHGDHLVMTGPARRTIVDRGNDSDEDDLWVGDFDLAAGTFTHMLNQDLHGDDLPRSIARTSDGTIFVGGDNGAHFVDSGSHDGGAEAFIARLTPEWTIEETVTLGGANDRYASAGHLLLGATQVLAAGIWDGPPSNHSEGEDVYWRTFAAPLLQKTLTNADRAVAAWPVP